MVHFRSRGIGLEQCIQLMKNSRNGTIWFHGEREKNTKLFFYHYLASSSLAIYLIHEHPLMREIIYVKPFMKIIYMNPYYLFGTIIIFSILLSVICMLMDKIRVFIFNLIDKPISIVSDKIEKKIEL